MTIRNSARRVVAVSLTGLTLAATSAGLVTTSASAAVNPNEPNLNKQTTHTPMTQMSKTQAAAAACHYQGPADDAVLKVLKSAADDNKVTSKVRLAIFETAWVESMAKDIPCGDLDSVGVFQQRAGWGSSADRQNVPYAVKKFLNGNGTSGAIALDKAHSSWTAGQISQGVQVSAKPDAYDQAEATAKKLIDRSNKLSDIKGGDFTWPLTQSGEKHERTAALQELLNEHGAKLDVDGSFGPATKAAVVSFQGKEGLGKDGLAGKDTWSHAVKTVKPGSSGSAVKGLQHLLKLYDKNVKVTGKFDAATEKAVSSARKTYHLSEGTTADSDVWNALVALNI